MWHPFILTEVGDFMAIPVTVFQADVPHVHYLVQATGPICTYVTDEKGVELYKQEQPFDVFCGHTQMKTHEVDKNLPAGNYILLIYTELDEPVGGGYELLR
jgi:hypothetical protein